MIQKLSKSSSPADQRIIARVGVIVAGNARHDARRTVGGSESRQRMKSTRRIAVSNPRPPAVPATLGLTLEEYFAAAALMGLLAAQDEEFDQDWASEWALDIGAKMATKALARRGRQAT
jgi:hypothetical protein